MGFQTSLSLRLVSILNVLAVLAAFVFKSISMLDWRFWQFLGKGGLFFDVFLVSFVLWLLLLGKGAFFHVFLFFFQNLIFELSALVSSHRTAVGVIWCLICGLRITTTGRVQIPKGAKGKLSLQRAQVFLAHNPQSYASNLPFNSCTTSNTTLQYLQYHYDEYLHSHGLVGKCWPKDVYNMYGTMYTLYTIMWYYCMCI